MQRVDPRARFEQALGCIEQIEFGADAERLAGIAHHRLHDRAVILHPAEPWRIPDPREMHRRRMRGVVVRIVQVDRKHLVADPVQGVEPRIAFLDAVGGDLALKRIDLGILLQHEIELAAQRHAFLDAGLLAEDLVGKAREAAGPEPGQQQRDADALL
ncbi:hypothetical protein SB7C_12425, partial [Staphylococcus epidermidis]